MGRGARGVANTSFLGQTGRHRAKKAGFSALARNSTYKCCFFGTPGASMSVELVRWAKKVGDFVSTPVGTQRACPLVPTDIRHMAVERAPAPLAILETGARAPPLFSARTEMGRS